MTPVGADAPRLSFKEMVARFDVTPRTLRYYESIELLFPERDGPLRWYTPREVARMTLILRGRRFGFSLEEIRQWLDIYDERGTRAQMALWLDLADRQLGVLRGQRDQLDETIAALEQLHAQTRAQMDREPAEISGSEQRRD